MCLKARRERGQGPQRGPAAGPASPRNGPSRLRRDSAGPGGRPGPPHPPQPEPCAAAAAAANTAAPAPDATRRLLAVGRAVGLRGRGRRPPPGPCRRRRRVSALRPRRAPARPGSWRPAGGRQLLQPPAAAAASHLRAPGAPGTVAQPQLQSQSQSPGRVLAQRLALAPPALPSCFHMQYQSRTGRQPPPRKRCCRCIPVLAAPSWVRAGGLGPLYLPFSFRPGWGERKGNPPKTTENTHRIGDYLFVFNLFCHIFVKRQKCNKKYISTVPKGGAVEKGRKGPDDEVGATSLGAWQA